MRTYIFAYAETYDCISLERLAEMFELPLQSVHSIVSKMIFKEEFLVKKKRGEKEKLKFLSTCDF